MYSYWEKDIRDISLKSLNEMYATVLQDVYLFQIPILENIRLGRSSATDEEVIEAAKKAFAHEFITELPDGYQTIAGEGGVKLSGGQRQRIAIARAFLKVLQFWSLMRQYRILTRKMKERFRNP
mgnify:CR=1 FL=1